MNPLYRKACIRKTVIDLSNSHRQMLSKALRQPFCNECVRKFSINFKFMIFFTVFINKSFNQFCPLEKQ